MGCNSKRELKLGIEVEKEHAHNFPKNVRMAIRTEIAKDHIREFPCYYSKGLIPMEKKLKKMKGGR
jgi:hypothetical protein